jgi:deoxyribonuclease-4
MHHQISRRDFVSPRDESIEKKGFFNALKLGVHVSIGEGLISSVKYAKRLGCNTMQIFNRSPQSWAKSNFKEIEIEYFRKELKTQNIDPLVVHASYLINLASNKKRLYNKSIEYCMGDITQCDRLGAAYFVIHPGSYVDSDEISGLKRLIRALNTVIKNSNTALTILLENTSGSGSLLGGDLRHFDMIFDNICRKDKIGFCLDSAHAFEAGYDVTTKKGLDFLLRSIDRFIGLERIKLIHLNDSKSPLGSRFDRHEHLGKGSIGRKGLGIILNSRYLRDLPFILETPKMGYKEDKANLDFVRELTKN